MNQSAMLLKKNGRKSAGKRSRHLNIRYFYITDLVKKGHLTIQFCPPDEMAADFFTKPLTGQAKARIRMMKAYEDYKQGMSIDDWNKLTTKEWGRKEAKTIRLQ